jgi:ATP-binding cassette subfamily F protein 3
MLAVSHDRYFMDSVITTIWEMAWGRIEVYRGNYSHYIQQREHRHARLLKEYEAQQEFIAKEENFIRRYMAGQKTTQAKGRLRRLERLKRDDLIERPQSERTIHINLKTDLRSGDKVLMTYRLVAGYHRDRPLVKAPDITLYRGEIAAVIGPNGAGKTTLLKTLLGELPPLSGSSRLGAAVQPGYFAQAHEGLNPNNSVIDELFTVRSLLQGEARNYLAQFLFTGDDVFRPVSTLSGGERGRLALAKMALDGANFLLLDEPTNHLDIPSQEILQDVLDAFNGTILLVSHDRYLIDALATQIWDVQPGKMTVFEGPYQEYLQAREASRQGEREPQAARVEPKPAASQPANGKPAKPGKPEKQALSPFQRERRLQEIEQRIHKLEIRLVELSGELGEASAAGAVDRVRDLGETYNATEGELEHAMHEWEALLEEN